MNVHPGEQIGIRLAHRVLADITQDSLSSFHNAGLENTTRGLTLQDIIDGTGIGSMSVAVNPKKTERFKREVLSRKFKYYVREITNSILEYFEDGNFWYLIGRRLRKIPEASTIKPEDIIIVRFYLDYKRLREDNRTLEYIVSIVFDNYEFVYFSPDFMGIIDVHISNLIELSSIIRLVDKPLGIDEIKGVSLAPMQDIADLTAQLSATDIGKREIMGAPDDRDETIYQTVNTQGSNLGKICAMRYIDATKTISTDIYDVEKNFGLEAAREVIYQEVLSKVGDPVNADFIADFMTCKGYVSAFKKDNPMLRDKGFLSSIAFERPKKDIKNAMAKDVGDDISSVYSQIIAGVLPNVGSGSRLFELL